MKYNTVVNIEEIFMHDSPRGGMTGSSLTLSWDRCLATAMPTGIPPCITTTQHVKVKSVVVNEYCVVGICIYCYSISVG